jgi:hypothetical protein
MEHLTETALLATAELLVNLIVTVEVVSLPQLTLRIKGALNIIVVGLAPD